MVTLPLQFTPSVTLAKTAKSRPKTVTTTPKWSPPNWCLPEPKWLAENSWVMKTKPAEPYQGKAGAQTLAIHAGEPKKHGVNTGVGTTISRTSTFTFSSTQEMKEWAEG